MRSRCRGTAVRLGVVIAVALSGPRVHAQTLAVPAPGTSTFIVFLHAAPIGAEYVDVRRTDVGWTIESGGQLSAPIGREARLFTVEYDHGWQPLRLHMDGTRNGQPFLIESQFEGGSAHNAVLNDGQTSSETHPIAATTVVLPDFFFGAYEALAVRLQPAAAGDALPVYIAPNGTVRLTLDEVLQQTLETSDRRFQATIYRTTFHYRKQPIEAEVWVDNRHRLLRVILPVADLDVVRQDISLVSTRLAGVTVPGDEEVFVEAAGFGLSATLTTPVDTPAPPDGWPAIVLVPGSASVDRDEPVSGVPIFGQLAHAFAGTGYLTVRYDRRGVGRSGGRPESATVDDYADDVRSIIDYLEDLDPVDDDRIAIVAHGEGSWVGLRAASREKKIAAAVLVAAPAILGRELVLEQQQAALDRLGVSDQERAERIELQRRINAAVVDDGPWDDIPAQIQRQADTPWFRSFLEFEPADVVRRTRQPVLIVHGLQDTTIPPYHADRLAEMAGRRRRTATVDLALLPGVNHALLQDTLAQPAAPEAENPWVSSEVTSVIIDWFDRILARD